MFRKSDVILIAFVLLSAVALVIGFIIFKHEGSIVKITENGKVLGKYSLSTDKTVSLDGNTIVIKNNKVSITKADCPDKICVKHSKIKSVGESIVCMPNSVVVSIEEK